MKWKDLRQQLNEKLDDDAEIGWIDIVWPRKDDLFLEVLPIKDTDPPALSVEGL